MAALLAVLAGVLGLLVGSFLNVVIYRVPRGESVVSPASRCPACGAPVRPQHNIPVAGWIALRGRCADCATPISPRYPLVELASGILFVTVTLRLHTLGLSPAIPAFLCFSAAGLALTLIDLDVQRLPNAIVLPLYPALAVLLAIAAAVEHAWWSLARAGISAVLLFAFFFAIALISPASMGFGDVKLSGVVGGVLGYVSWTALISGAFLGFLLGASVGLAVIGLGRGSRKTALPFGPFMISGALFALFVAPTIAGLY